MDAPTHWVSRRDGLSFDQIPSIGRHICSGQRIGLCDRHRAG
ncbi:hypothetical protein MTX36_14665 [Rhodococcus sp. ARC_M6]|nr:hypothetical protein [Rhodococcus sp. ARC_M6]